MPDVPVTQPEIDALLRDLEESRLHAQSAHLFRSAELTLRAITALAAERARADRAEQRIADALKSLADHMPRYGMELRPDGSEDPQAAAYVEGYGTAYQPVHEILSAKEASHE